MTARLFGAVAALAVAFAGGWFVNGWRLDAQTQAATVERERTYTRQVEALILKNTTLAAELVRADDEQLAKLRKAENATKTLRDCLRDGTCGLRVNASCPDPAQPQTEPGARVDTGTGAELDTTARRAYFALRDGIDRHVGQLAACQSQLRLRSGE